MDFVVRQGVRRVKAGGLRGMPRAGLNARNVLRAGTEGHSSAMTRTNNAAGRRETRKIVKGIYDTPH